jgi:arginine deiminase
MVEERLKATFRDVIIAKEEHDTIAEAAKRKNVELKELKAQLLELMGDAEIDKANYDAYSAAISTSTRKSGFTAKNMQAKLCEAGTTEEEAARLAGVMSEQCTVVQNTFLRLQKRKVAKAKTPKGKAPGGGGESGSTPGPGA